MLKTTSRFAFFFVTIAMTANAGAAEICGNALDDDADGLADEGCYPALTTGQCESPLSCTDTGMVSPSTGSLAYSLEPDISPRVPFGPGIGFRRFYLSQYAPGGGAPAYRTSLGPRWGHTYATWIDDVSAGGPSKIILHTTRGQDVLLNKTSSDATWEYFTPQPGHHYKEFKRRLASPNEYEIKTLTGESFQYDVGGRLKEIRDTLATPNKVLLTYDGNAQLSTVTDASGKRRLLFAYTGGVMTSMKFQILISAVWTDQHTTTFGYTSGNLTGVAIGGQSAQTNVYSSNYLTSIQDGGGKTLINFIYDGTTPGKLVRVDTPRGVVGYEFASSRANCSGKTVLYFHKQNTTSCNVDADCGTGYLCGGKTGAGSTGQCFRGARCLTVTSPSEDVITSITDFAGNGESCDGACLDAIDHVWNTFGGVLDLVAVKDPSNKYVTKTFNANGLPTQISYGDADSTPGGGKHELYIWYDATLPGKIAETRRQSDLHSGTCNAGTVTGCTQTLYSYNPDGLLSSREDVGYQYNSTGSAPAQYRNITTYTYDKGRLKEIDGPLSGANDVTQFEFFTSADPLKDGFIQNFKRKKDASNFIVQSSLTFDFWGNPTSLLDADGTVSCQTFDSARGHLTQRREQMAGQSDCTPNAADLVTSYTRDSALRLTQLMRPDDSCMIYEYDSRGRLSKLKRRDDCNAVSSGDTEEFTYSDEGLLSKTELKDASGTVTKRQELTYFDSRRLEKMINPVNTAKWSGVTYDSRGLLSTVSALDGASTLSKTEWSYDEARRLTSEKRYLFSGPTAFDVWNLVFGWFGDQIQVTDGDSKLTESRRDDMGHIVRLVSPDQGGDTLRLYDEAGRLTTIKEVLGGGANEKVHTFTFDNIGRPLNSDYSGTCSTFNVPDIVRVYDSLTGAPSCPVGTSCTNLAGRLAYVKVKLMCTTAAGPDGDFTLEQETWYGYDAAGRVTHEYISDDNGRTAAQVYTWTKNGALETTTLPSGAVLGASFDSVNSNSDMDRVTALWRTSTGTPIIDNILYEPFGPFRQYNQMNTSSGIALRTKVSRNLAYRVTETKVETQTGGTTLHSVAITEDNKGRVTGRDYTPNISGLVDSYFVYDGQDRVLCELPSPASSCPTTFGGEKNNHYSGAGTANFTAAGDWKTLSRPITGSTGWTHAFSLAAGTHQISQVNQSNGSPTHGITQFTYDPRGNRISDDNTSSLSNDQRTYVYDSRRNVINVHGRYFAGPRGCGVTKTDPPCWDDYDVASAFDAQNRRVYKSYYQARTNTTSTWFFYYDALSRLVEIRHTPSTAAPSSYNVFQLIWLGDQLVGYWETNYPSVTTSKRYVGRDESGRPIDMLSWPTSGDATRVWAINPSAWGFDSLLVNGAFQPVMFAGQYQDTETNARYGSTSSSLHRPGLVLNGFRTYDPWTGSYLQIDPAAELRLNYYVYGDSNPVGKADPSGADIPITDTVNDEIVSLLESDPEIIRTDSVMSRFDKRAATLPEDEVMNYVTITTFRVWGFIHTEVCVPSQGLLDVVQFEVIDKTVPQQRAGEPARLKQCFPISGLNQFKIECASACGGDKNTWKCFMDGGVMVPLEQIYSNTGPWFHAYGVLQDPPRFEGC